MKTIALYVLGIPFVLLGSRFAGLDKALFRESAPPPATLVDDQFSDTQVDQFAPADVTFPEFEPTSTPISQANEPLTAVVVPEKSACVKAMAKGILREILVRPNDVVNAGTRLAVLDTREIEADVRKQHQQTLLFESKVRQARGEQAKFMVKLEKRAPLVEKRVITVEEYRELQLDLQAATERIKQFVAEVSTSREEETKLQGMLDDFVVTAPFSGRVKRVVQQAGQFLQQGDVILEMESTSKQVWALVPTSLSARIQEFTFHVEDPNGERVQLTVAEIQGTSTTIGFQDVLFDLEEAQQVISNQSLAVYATCDNERATLEQEVSSSLAAR